jgi:conjugal transfer/entry exclusion protein
MSFENQIQQWVSLDNQMKIYAEKIKELRDKKNSITENIQQHVKTNQLSQSTIQISDGKLKFVETRVSEPLTFKYLEKSLSEIIKNESQVKMIMEHVKKNREIKVNSEIKRFYKD